MENQRQNYRHDFSSSPHLSVELESATLRRRFLGRIVNLSIDGMRIWLLEPDDIIQVGERLLVTWRVGDDDKALSQTALVVYSQNVAGQPCVGLRFIASVNQTTVEHRRDVIWRFLMREQRRILARR